MRNSESKSGNSVHKLQLQCTEKLGSKAMTNTPKYVRRRRLSPHGHSCIARHICRFCLSTDLCDGAVAALFGLLCPIRLVISASIMQDICATEKASVCDASKLLTRSAFLSVTVK